MKILRLKEVVSHTTWKSCEGVHRPGEGVESRKCKNLRPESESISAY